MKAGWQCKVCCTKYKWCNKWYSKYGAVKMIVNLMWTFVFIRMRFRFDEWAGDAAFMGMFERSWLWVGRKITSDKWVSQVLPAGRFECHKWPIREIGTDLDLTWRILKFLRTALQEAKLLGWRASAKRARSSSIKTGRQAICSDEGLTLEMWALHRVLWRKTYHMPYLTTIEITTV